MRTIVCDPVLKCLVSLGMAAVLVLAAACVAAESGGPAPAGGAAPAPGAGAAGKRKIVFIPGPPSHGYGNHSHLGGCNLLAKFLNENVPAVEAVVLKDGWPKDPAALAGASAIVLSCDGGSLVSQHLAELDALVGKGIGLACLHYTVDVPKGKVGQKMLDWIGGYYEQGWSVNPTWTADFQKFPDHPVARGVKPFRVLDEWYYHMRFREEMKGVTPILSAVPPDSTRKGPDGAHSGNPTVRSRTGMAEDVAWAYQRPDGGRGFGFTGMHTHWNWACDGFRTAVLNAVVWIAGAEVPAGGVPSKRPTLEELESCLGVPRPAGFKPEPIQKLIDGLNK